MKKFFFAAVLCALSSCSPLTSLTNPSIAENIRAGMTLKEFLWFAGEKAGLEALTPASTVYSIEYYGIMPGGGYSVAGKRLFHFDSEGKLVKMESEDFRKHYQHSEKKEEKEE